MNGWLNEWRHCFNTSFIDVWTNAKIKNRLSYRIT